MLDIKEARAILQGVEDITDEDLEAILMTMYVMAEEHYDTWEYHENQTIAAHRRCGDELEKSDG